MSTGDTVQSRSDLISLLSEACELEHGLACSYLYSAFTLKQSVYENDLTWQQFQFTRKWAGQLYVIASQEMMHLSQAWNLLNAIGGTPYYFRPNFPQSHKYYPIGLPLKLEPFGKEALKRFIFYELPEEVSNEDYLEKEFHIPASRFDHTFTVGKLYSIIRDGFNTLNAKGGLFIGKPELQVGEDVCHFPQIVKVVDIASANKAIDTIMEQGEGTVKDQVDCHYGLFLNVNKELDDEIKNAGSKKFMPARNTIHNPVAFRGSADEKAEDDSSSNLNGANPVTDLYTNEVLILFDNVYSIMLRMLQYVFQSGPLPNGMQATLSGAAIQIMVRALKPLGEALTQLPAGEKKYGKQTAGPAFGLYRHVPLPDDYKAARIVIKERLSEIIATGKSLCLDPRAPDALKSGVEKLEHISAFIFEPGFVET